MHSQICKILFCTIFPQNECNVPREILNTSWITVLSNSRRMLGKEFGRFRLKQVERKISNRIKWERNNRQESRCVFHSERLSSFRNPSNIYKSHFGIDPDSISTDGESVGFCLIFRIHFFRFSFDYLSIWKTSTHLKNQDIITDKQIRNKLRFNSRCVFRLRFRLAFIKFSMPIWSVASGKKSHRRENERDWGGGREKEIDSRGA